MVFKLYSVNTPLHHITSWNLEVLELCNEELNIYQKLPNYYSVNNNFFPDETLTDCPFFFAHFWNQGTYKTLQHVSTRMTCCNVLYVPRFQKRVKKMGNRSEFDSERNYYVLAELILYLQTEETLSKKQTSEITSFQFAILGSKDDE